jgi:hypothetical protein
MTHDRTRATGKNGTELARAFDQTGMAQGVNTAIKGMQPSGSQPVVDCVARQSRLEELCARDDPSLPRGKLRDWSVGSSRHANRR